MYEKLYSVNNNNISVNLEYFRTLLNDNDVNNDEIIESIVQMNNDIIKINKKKLVFIIDVDCLNIHDIRYINFFIKLLFVVQERFKQNIKMIQIVNSNKIFKSLFEKISVFMNADVLERFNIK
jgi:hypothetical protein